MKNLILYISLTLLANCLIAQEFIGVAASHKLVTPSVKTTSSVCPNGSEQTVSANETFEKELVELINLERASVGAPPVKLINELTYSSRYHSDDMADQDYFSHNSVSGCTTFDRISAFYSYMSAGENIASGFSNPETVHQGFINSPPHYSTMINASYNEVGVGYSFNSQASGQTRWVENFGSRQGNYPIIINLEAISTDSVEVEIYAHGKDDFDEIRFINDGGSWSNWMTFDVNEFNWTIAGSPGENTVVAEMRNGSITKSSQDEIEYNGVSTSIADGFDVPEMEFFPNPATNILYLYNVEKYTSYRVYNIQGQEVVNGNFAGRSSTQEINVEHLYKGQFLLILQSPASTAQELFLKM